MNEFRHLLDQLREATLSDFAKKWLAKLDKQGDKQPEKSSTGWTHGASTSLFPALPETPPRPSKWQSAGCVILPSLHPDDLNYVYVIKPSNNFGPYSFPKGRIDKGETARAAARREVAEETGLVVALLPGGDLGKGAGSMSVTHYFMAVQVGGSPGQHDQEVERVKLVTFDDARKLFTKDGNKRDIEILNRAWKFTERFRQRTAGRELGDTQPASKTKAAKTGYGTGYKR